MDTPEHSDQVLQKLTGIEGQLRSLRYTFGIGIIILAVFLTLVVPSVLRNYSFARGWGGAKMMDQGGYDLAPAAEKSVEEAPATSPTPTASTTP